VRILLTTDVVGGVWSYTEELVDALAGAGHDVALVSLGGEPRTEHRAWLAERPALRYTALPHALEWMPDPEPSLAASVDALREISARFSPDVIHLNQFFYGAFDLGAPTLVVAHSDVVGWWRAVHEAEPPDDPWFRRYRGWVRDGLAGAAAVAAPSASMAADIAGCYGRKARVIHNARTPSRFAPSPGRREPVAVSVGRLWDEAKGVRDLARAAARMRAGGGGGPGVVVAGPVRHPAGGDDFPADVPGLEWVGVLPADQLAALLGRAAIYVATSRYEPFGLAPLEAALAGCALVMADIRTFRELWDGAAAFYPPGDDAALAALLESLHDEPRRRAAIAAACRARALERFTPDRMAIGYLALYDEIARAAAYEGS
jgi:glycogen synthase